MMWPFKSKPDTRPATAAAQAIAESLRNEPQRWSLHGDDYLKHDSGVIIDMPGWIRRPDLDAEPDANGELVRAAIHDWINGVLSLPVPQPQTIEANVEQA